MTMTKIWLALAVTTLGLGLGAAAAGLEVGPYALRLKAVWICAGIAASVYAVMLYRLLAAEVCADSSGSGRRAELLWALIPAVILIGLALPAVDTLADLAAEPGPGPVIAASSTGAK